MKKFAFLFILISFALINACSGDDNSKKKKPQKKEKKEAKSYSYGSDSEDDQTKEPITFTDAELKTAKEIVSKVSSADFSGIDAKKLYRGKCGACHGLNGKLGVSGAGDLTKSQLSIEESVALMYHGRGMMTPFEGVLSSMEMVAVANYVKENFME